MKSRFAIGLFFFISICLVFNNKEWKKNIYTSDNTGYYLYLPATIIYHGLGSLSFLQSVQEKYPTIPVTTWFIYDGAAGKKNDKYAIGTCLFELPLFLAAHAYCLATHKYAADGFSAPYQWAGIFSCILWVVAGLFVLRKFLLCYYNDLAVAVAILCISLGTNLYYYTVFEPGFSHPYSFFLFSSILYCTRQWYGQQCTKYLYLLGFLLGLVAVTRPVNIIVAVIPLLWEVNSLSSLKQRLRSFYTHKKAISISLFLFLCMLSLQLAYWKFSSGHWLYFSYKGEGFDFLHPRIRKGLFSYRKGWFVYAPVAFISLTIGIPALWFKNKKLILAIIVFFSILIYVVFSWRNWWYGGGFGCRPLIESMAVLSLPLTALAEKVFSYRRILFSLSFFVMISGFIVLNLFQSWQFSVGIIHYDRMSKEYYWRVFGKTKINPLDYEKYLMDEHEYWREITRISY